MKCEKEKFMTTSKHRQFKGIFYRIKKKNPETQQSLQELPFNYADADKTNYCKKTKNKTKFYSTPGRNSY